MSVQDLIHKYEVGSGYGVLKFTLAILAMVALATWYDLNGSRILLSAEGMDAAQAGRNISEGRGFTTSFVRPFSVFLLNRHQNQGAVAQTSTSGSTNQPAAARAQSLSSGDRIPELSQGPAYPLLLAGVLRAMPFDYPDLLTVRSYVFYTPDLWIAAFNQLLFLIAAILVFHMGRDLFDQTVGWTAAVIFAGTDLFWRFSVAGNPTMLVILIVAVLTWVLARLDRFAVQGGNPLGLALAAGLLVGLAGLTRYACALLILPVLAFIALIPTPRRAMLMIATIFVFLAVMSPWIIRNVQLSGTPFGTAGYAACQLTSSFPGQELERAVTPNFNTLGGAELWEKFLTNSREMLRNDLPRFGGSWISALFLVGFLVPFRNLTLRRLRLFLVLALVTLFIAQALGRTWISLENPEVNSENLLVILAGPVFVFGISLFYVLLEPFTAVALRIWVAVLLIILACAPLFLGLAGTRPSPYFPPTIQDKSAHVGQDQLVMSDIPWAGAWYGNRQNVWLTLKYRAVPDAKYPDDFWALERIFRPVSALYLTSRTLKELDVDTIAAWRRGESTSQAWKDMLGLAKKLAARLDKPDTQADLENLRELLRLVDRHWIRGGEGDWGEFVLGVYLQGEVPTGFPLRDAPLGLLPELFLTDSERNPRKTIQSDE